MSGYLKIKVVEARKLEPPAKRAGQPEKPNDLRPIVQLKFKYGNESTQPSIVRENSASKYYLYSIIIDKDLLMFIK